MKRGVLEKLRKYQTDTIHVSISFLSDIDYVELFTYVLRVIITMLHPI